MTSTTKIILVTMFSALLFCAGCSSSKLNTVSDEAEANEILNLLLAYGIPASKVEVTDKQVTAFEIRVDGGENAYRAAVSLLEDHCLPRKLPEEIESKGLIVTPAEEKARENRRTKIEIESQLRKLPGATCVDVNIVAAKQSGLDGISNESSATVLLKYKTETFAASRKQVARMVAGAVSGLEADRVVVTMTKQPLRELPDFKSSMQTTRLFLAGGGAILTIFVFVAAAVFLRRRRINSTALVQKEAES